VFETLEKQIEYWNGKPPALVGPLSSPAIGKVLRTLHPAPMGRVLDFGCGIGRIYRGLEPLDYYVGVDISKSYLDFFRRENPEAQVIQVESFKIPLPKDDFDTVTCYSVFTHLPPEHVDLVLAEFHRVLKPGGMALASIFELEVTTPPAHHNWILIELQRFLDLCKKNGFKPVDRTEVPTGWGSHQTLFKLENMK